MKVNDCTFSNTPTIEDAVAFRAEIERLRAENEQLKHVLMNPDPDNEPDNVRLHREKMEWKERAEAAERQLAECRDALKAFCFGDPVMEKILWGKLPDDATGSVTVKLRDFRRARKALETQNQPIAECREKGR